MKEYCDGGHPSDPEQTKREEERTASMTTGMGSNSIYFIEINYLQHRTCVRPYMLNSSILEFCLHLGGDVCKVLCHWSTHLHHAMIITSSFRPRRYCRSRHCEQTLCAALLSSCGGYPPKETYHSPPPQRRHISGLLYNTEAQSTSFAPKHPFLPSHPGPAFCLKVVEAEQQ